MRNTTPLWIGLAVHAVWLVASSFSTAQEQASTRYREAAVVEWDGGDTGCVNPPNRQESFMCTSCLAPAPHGNTRGRVLPAVEGKQPGQAELG